MGEEVRYHTALTLPELPKAPPQPASLFEVGVHPLEEEWVALDVETTGLSPEDDEIIEVGAVRFRGAETLDSFHSLVNPEPEDRRLHQEVHGNRPAGGGRGAALLEGCGAAGVVRGRAAHRWTQHRLRPGVPGRQGRQVHGPEDRHAGAGVRAQAVVGVLAGEGGGRARPIPRQATQGTGRRGGHQPHLQPARRGGRAAGRVFAGRDAAPGVPIVLGARLPAAAARDPQDARREAAAHAGDRHGAPRPGERHGHRRVVPQGAVEAQPGADTEQGGAACGGRPGEGPVEPGRPGLAGDGRLRGARGAGGDGRGRHPVDQRRRAAHRGGRDGRGQVDGLPSPGGAVRAEEQRAGGGVDEHDQPAGAAAEQGRARSGRSAARGRRRTHRRFPVQRPEGAEQLPVPEQMVVAAVLRGCVGRRGADAVEAAGVDADDGHRATGAS